MKKVIISPYSRLLRNGKENPKNYPYFPQVVAALKAKNIYTIQVGSHGEKSIGADEVQYNLPLKKLTDLILSCDTWISIDNFFQHLANIVQKKGIVIWGMSDPKLFGYSQNINIIKNRKYLRPGQFDTWEQCEYNTAVFVEPQAIVEQVLKVLELA